MNHPRQRRVWAIVAGCLTLCTAPGVWAQTVTGEAIAEELQRQAERERRLRERQEAQPDVRLPAPPAADPGRLPADETPCFPIREILLEGHEADRFHWALAAADPADDPATGRCLGGAGIDLVMKRIQNALVQRGLVTTRVLAAPQDLTGGALRLTILPGRVRAIRADGGDPRATLWNALPLSPGDLLDLRAVEHGLENLKHVPTAEADIRIEPAEGPGAAPGDSDLVVAWTQRFPFRINLTLDDAGGETTGKYQGGATLSYDHALTLNDLLYLSFNRDLAGGAARVILNEINSSNPSLLRGYTEVAGQSAQVVIANPAGVTCDGCGFINANRATLTTGTPVISGAALDGYRVEGGAIRIEGAGMDTGGGHADLIARAVEINAGLWADRLAVTTGANAVDADNTQATPIAGSGPAPAFALDVAHLGGMYAGKIHLIGTEHGVGVRNAGQIYAGIGGVRVTLDGRLENAGEIAAAGDLSIAATGLDNRHLIDGQATRLDIAGTLDNLGTGRIYGDHLAIAAGTLNNHADGDDAPVIAARDRLDLGVGTLDNRDGALVFSAGDMAIGGALDTNGRATGAADTLANASATIESLGHLALAARQIDNTNETFATAVEQSGPVEDIAEYQGAGSLNRYAPDTPEVYTYSNESLHLHTPEGNYESWHLYDYQRTTYTTVVTASAPARIAAGGDLDIEADAVLNDNSHILAGGDLAGRIGDLRNTAAPGTETVLETGTVYSYWREHEKGRDSTGSSAAAYNPAPRITEINLSPTRYEGGAAPGGGAAPAGLSGSLYRPAPDPTAGYLVETDPAFASYRDWLSSDYLLQQLAADPATMQKRLGDGFYEQRQIAEQVGQLTGRRHLGGHADDEAQYRALMDAGVTVAQDWHLVPGVALSAEQIARLTSDIVWLVEQNVTLPDGRTETALVPRVYLAPRAGDVSPTGGLFADRALTLDLAGDLINSGTLAGRQILSLTAENLRNLGGTLQGGETALAARQDIQMQGGTLTAADALTLTAGRDIAVASTTRTQETAQGSRTNLGRIAGLYVTGATGTLLASAGRDLTLVAADLQSRGGATLAAGNDLSLGTLTENRSDRIVWDGNNRRSDARTSETGTAIATQGDLQLLAGRDLTARAASVEAGGALTAAAGNDIHLTAGEASVSLDEAHRHTSSGFLSRTTRSTRDTLAQTTAVASSLGGETVSVQAGRDLTVSGSNVVADQGATLVAGRDLKLEAATETHAQSHFESKKKSGLFSSGAGITLGTQQQSLDQKGESTTAAGSTVGSVAGDVTLLAGESYRQVGSDVLAPGRSPSGSGGDVTLAARTVDIVEARETSQSRVEQKFKQSGLTVSISNPVVTAVQTVGQMTRAAGDTRSGRMQALAAASAALAGKNAHDAVQTGQAVKDGNLANQAGGVSLSVSLGSSKSRSTSAQASDTARSSTVAAGNDVTVLATGAGAQSDLTVRGSTIQGGRDVNLLAEDEIRLLAAANTASQQSSNQSSSASIGVSFNLGAQTGVSVGVSASRGKGAADGSDTVWTNTKVGAGETASLASGGDTTLKGAVVSGQQVQAEVGGNLAIESLQDTSTYQSRDKSSGFSIAVPISGGMPDLKGIGGSVSAGQSKIDSTYASVTEQSGIRAGDEGFQVAVQGDTNLKGGAITSTQPAIDDGRNRFATGGTLMLADMANRAEYEGSGASINLGAGISTDGQLAPQGTSAGIGEDSGKAQSMTLAAISGIAGNKNARTGDAETGIERIFDAERVKKEIAAQVAITQAFNEHAPKAAATYSASQAADLKRQAELETDPARKAELLDEASKWGPNGTYNIAMNIIIGAAGGNLKSAVTKETLSWAANEMRQAMIEDSKKFKGLCDAQNNCISNISGQSVGVNGDDKKIAGGRIVLSDWCADGRCQKDETTVSGYAENPDGTVKFNPTDKDGNPITLTTFIEENQSWRSELGGHQGGLGQMKLFGIQFDYEKGSFWDKLAEAYAGTHDTLNSIIWYDKLGNSKNLDESLLGTLGDITNMTNVAVATPLALSVFLPPEVWNAISILIKANQH